MKLQIVKLMSSTQLPTRGSFGSAGWDIYCPKDVILDKGLPTTIPLRFKIKIPEGYYATIVPRSSLGNKGIMISNSPGTIDSDYIGEWCCSLVYNGLSPSSYHIQKGDRIAQIILHKYETLEWEEVESLPRTSRGEGGFGSTGK